MEPVHNLDPIEYVFIYGKWGKSGRYEKKVAVLSYDMNKKKYIEEIKKGRLMAHHNRNKKIMYEFIYSVFETDIKDAELYEDLIYCLYYTYRQQISIKRLKFHLNLKNMRFQDTYIGNFLESKKIMDRYIYDRVGINFLNVINGYIDSSIPLLKEIKKE